MPQKSIESDCHSGVHIGAQNSDRLMQSVLTRSDRFVPIHANFSQPTLAADNLLWTSCGGPFHVSRIADDVEQCTKRTWWCRICDGMRRTLDVLRQRPSSQSFFLQAHVRSQPSEPRSRRRQCRPPTSLSVVFIAITACFAEQNITWVLC